MASEHAKKMAALFDIDFESSLDDSNSDYDARAKDSDKAESFDSKARTIQAIMDHEAVPQDVVESQKATDVAHVAASTEHEQANVSENGGDPDELLRDAIKEFTDSELETLELEAPAVKPENKEAAPKVEENHEVIPPKASSPNAASDDDNPLGLIGDDYRFFCQVKTEYPQFTLYDGNPAYKDFYRYKTQVLRYTLSQFPVLDFESRRKEIRAVNCNHTVGKTVSGEIIRAKLDECYRSRIRVAQLLAEAYEQLYVWEKNSELLESKLWTDHESRGAHKRQALVLSHMHTESMYVQQMQGFIQAAKIIDGLLVAAADSLSRQLTCISLKEPSSADHVYRHEQAKAASAMSSADAGDPKMDSLDSISDGSVISAPGRSGAARVVTSLGKFDPDDDLMNLS